MADIFEGYSMPEDRASSTPSNEPDYNDAVGQITGKATKPATELDDKGVPHQPKPKKPVEKADKEVPKEHLFNEDDEGSSVEDVLAEIKAKYGNKKIKAKYRGQEKELAIADILKNPSAHLSVNEAMEEAAKNKKMAEQILSGLQSDPLKAIKYINGGNLPDNLRKALLEETLDTMSPEERSKILEKRLLQDAEWNNLSPEEKETRRKLQKLEELEKQEQVRARQEQVKKVQEQFAQEQKTMMDEIGAAMVEAELPESDGMKTAVLRETLMVLMQDAARAKKTGSTRKMSAKKAVSLAKDRIYKGFEAAVESLPEDRLVEMFPSVAAKIRKHVISQAKNRQKGLAPQGQPARQTSKKSAAPKKNQDGILSLEELMAGVRK